MKLTLLVQLRFVFQSPRIFATSFFVMGGGTLKDLYTIYVINRLSVFAISASTVSPPALTFLHPCLPWFGCLVTEKIYSKIRRPKNKRKNEQFPMRTELPWNFSMSAASSIAAV